MDGKGEEAGPKGSPYCTPVEESKLQVPLKREMFSKNVTPIQKVDFWEVFLSFFKNSLLTHAFEGTFDIKLE